jgi:(1->4)-alpha-D-glucan 1-alpha-D-glucosylmutase
MSRDFTYPALLKALREVIACFPVYRTYVPPHGWDVDEADYGHVMHAVRWAKLRNPTMDWSALDFIASVLLLQFPRADEPDREQFRDFVLRFQQITGPVTAKGIEDTAFYRYYPCAALNEVGGELNASALAPEEFHRRMQHRLQDWPQGLSATATHDTKRGEDVRARLLALTEFADEWVSAVTQWQQLNRPLLRTAGEMQVPSLNEEYLIYQTVVGTWPRRIENDEDRRSYLARIISHAEKALREAKINTSWSMPAAEYEDAVRGFITDLFNPQISTGFLASLAAFVAKIADSGYINSLSQLVLKAIVPGVPDFYQGCELWDFNLVDPDNRRPVDYELRASKLVELEQRFSDDPASLATRLAQNWPDPAIKLFITWRLLQLRAEYPSLFEAADYLPLTVSGSKAENMIAFARRHEGQYVVTMVPLHVNGLMEREGEHAMPRIDWGDTVVELPDGVPRSWLNYFSQQRITVEGNRRIAASEALTPLPVAVFKSDTNPECLNLL